MRKLIKIVIVLSVNMLYLSLSSTKTKAEEVGALKINNQVIYQDNQQKKNVEVNFIIPDLFLPIKAEREKEVNQSKVRVVNEAKNDVFRTEQNAKTLAVDKKVRPFLFKETATVTSPESIESLEVHREISINFWLYSGIFLGSIVILFVGVFLGNRFSYHRAQSGN
ncbi:hypothetical protein WOA_01587 [Enterococcus faecalis EnGen0356]|uniref:hypothetical protein n=1 Tax=Enterococcus faecalis TaxID=1351 RepID=UPI00032E793E|nr:hypothetical protein [Enterococcus faecalis]EOJ78716.1 hypothetical protein WOA_01587 [Enterococcus faecalis EnGen0356]